MVALSHFVLRLFARLQWTNERATLEFPRGGSQALADALAACITRGGGKVYVNEHVEEILVENGRAVGVRYVASDAFAFLHRATSFSDPPSRLNARL